MDWEAPTLPLLSTFGPIPDTSQQRLFSFCLVHLLSLSSVFLQFSLSLYIYLSLSLSSLSLSLSLSPLSPLSLCLSIYLSLSLYIQSPSIPLFSPFLNFLCALIRQRKEQEHQAGQQQERTKKELQQTQLHPQHEPSNRTIGPPP